MRKTIARPTRLRPRDAAGEAFTSIAARPQRAILTCVGTLLAVAWFVAALGLVSTASGQLATVFTDRLATQVSVTPVLGSASRSMPVYPFPPNVQRRVGALRGVVAAGLYWQLKLATAVVVSASPTSAAPPESGSTGAGDVGPPVIAASPGFLAAAGVKISVGRTYGPYYQAHADQVCLLGAAAARSLGISGLRHQRSIYINDIACVLLGIVNRSPRHPSVLRSVLLPTSTAIRIWGPPDEQAGAEPAVLIQVRPGAARLVARQAPYAISPARPHQFAVAVPASPVLLRRQVNGTLTGLFRVMGWTSLGIGVLAVATIAMISVPGRTGEFGLRRAVGARRRHIASQVLAESVVIGLIGGLAGTSLGIAVVVIVAVTMNWVPVIAPMMVLPAPLAGAATVVLAGLLASLPGAWRRPARALKAFGPD